MALAVLAVTPSVSHAEKEGLHQPRHRRLSVLLNLSLPYHKTSHNVRSGVWHREAQSFFKEI